MIVAPPAQMAARSNSWPSRASRVSAIASFSFSTVDSVTESSVSPVSGSGSSPATTKASPPSILMALPRSILSTAIRPSPPRSSSARTRSRPAAARSCGGTPRTVARKVITGRLKTTSVPAGRRSRAGRAVGATVCGRAVAGHGGARRGVLSGMRGTAEKGDADKQHDEPNPREQREQAPVPVNECRELRFRGGDHEWTTARRYGFHARAPCSCDHPREVPRIRPAAWRAAAAVHPTGTSPSGCRSRRRIHRSRRAGESSATWRSP